VLALAVVGPLLLRDDDSDSTESAAVVARVIDGDTLELADGSRVRLVQIDTPEAGEECYAERATALTRRLLPPGTRVTLDLDPRLDEVDRYRRRLAYVRKGGENVNVTLVRRGAASVWFFHGTRGRYADELLAAAQQARAERRGLWSACPLARLDPARALATGSG
jgi:micrococcal nuclease